ncbi:hypothetical protein LCGC14_1878320, partial [marine sediment metagenome]
GHGKLAAKGKMPAPMRKTIAPYLYAAGSWHNTNPAVLDEVMLYDTALTASQIKALATAAAGPKREAADAARPKPAFEETFDDNKNWRFNGNYAKPNFADYPGIKRWENGTLNGLKHPKGRPYLNIVDGIVSGCSKGYGGNPQSFEPTIIHRELHFDGSRGFRLEFRAISAAAWPNSVAVYLLSDWGRGSKKLKFYGVNIYGESSNHAIDLYSTSRDSLSSHLYRLKTGPLVNSWHTYALNRSADGVFELFVDGKKVDAFKPPKDNAYNRFNRIAISTLREGSKIDWIRLFALQGKPAAARPKPDASGGLEPPTGRMYVNGTAGTIKDPQAGWDGDFDTYTEAQSNGSRLQAISWETTETYRVPQGAKKVRLHAKIEHANWQSHSEVYVYDWVEEQYELMVGGSQSAEGVHDKTVPLTRAHVKDGRVKVRATLFAKHSPRAYARYYDSEILHEQPATLHKE